MAKAIPATLVSGVVKVGALSIPDAIVYSEGLSNSEGVLLIETSGAHYFPKVTPDLRATIEKTMASLEDVAAALNTIAGSIATIGAVPKGWAAAPPTLLTDAASIISKAAEITATRAELDALKGALK